ncbi:MAG: triosephosphate isomerase [Candidatus Doudnabacteria bacterium]|nr:triosephosphate isomerase [Candidatus Doudnabacteria bacterium]
MKKLIIGNWKLNPVTVREAVSLARKIDPKPKHEAVICPPAVFLASVQYPRVGAQDCFWENKGAHTGQVSPLALKSMKVKYCLVGHSERRNTGETEQSIKLKLESLLSVGIVPVLCVGHGTTVEQDDLEVTDVIKSQLQFALKGVDASRVVVAYEPVWAISSGNPYATKKTATPDHAEKISIFIRAKFKPMKVLYGGSANAANAHSYLSQPNIDGLLVGGASLLPKDFNAMINLSL